MQLPLIICLSFIATKTHYLPCESVVTKTHTAHSGAPCPLVPFLNSGRSEGPLSAPGPLGLGCSVLGHVLTHTVSNCFPQKASRTARLQEWGRGRIAKARFVSKSQRPGVKGGPDAETSAAHSVGERLVPKRVDAALPAPTW